MIGKEVPDRPDLRYVRKVGEDPIYIVEAKTDKLSARSSRTGSSGTCCKSTPST